MPTVMPAVPSCTPADRSKCPPIISSATATAMMPSVEAGSSQFAMPCTERKTSERMAKKMNTTMAPIREPSSGLSSSRRSGPTRATRSSAATAGVVMVPAMGYLQERWRGPGPPPPTGSTGSGGGQLLDRGRVVLGHQVRSGQHRLPATEDVQVGLVEGQHDHRQVALEVGLLVHGEQDLAALYRLGHVRVQVEGGQLGRGAGVEIGRASCRER